MSVGQVPVKSDNKRPDGVSLIPWHRGKAVVWDFTCAHRLCPSQLPFGATPIAPNCREESASQSVSRSLRVLQNSRRFQAALHRLYPQIGMRLFFKTGDKLSPFFFARGWASLSKSAMRSPSRTLCADPVLSLSARCSMPFDLWKISFFVFLLHSINCIILIIIINDNTCFYSIRMKIVQFHEARIQ